MGRLWVASALFVAVPFLHPTSLPPSPNLSKQACTPFRLQWGLNRYRGRSERGKSVFRFRGSSTTALSPAALPHRPSPVVLFSRGNYQKASCSVRGKQEYENWTILTSNSLNRYLTAPSKALCRGIELRSGQGRGTDPISILSEEEWLVRACTLLVASKSPRTISYESFTPCPPQL